MGSSLSSFLRVILIGSSLDLILFFRSSVPGRRSIGCIGSMIAFLCGVVGNSTCLTEWINSLWLPFSSVNVFVVVVAVVIVFIVVWDKFFGASVFVSRILLSIFRLSSLLFLANGTKFCNVLGFLKVVAFWLRSVSLCVCSIVDHTICLLLIRGFHTVQF